MSAEEDAPHYHRTLNPCQLRDDGTHAGIALSDQISARNHYPDRLILGYCPHPLKGDAPALLEAAYHMHNARVCGEWKFRVLLDDPRCLNLLRKAGELKMPVVFHLDVPYLPDGSGKMTYRRQWYGGTVDNLERALQACPETIFIGHAPGFWREISGDAAQDPEIYPRGPVTPGGRLYELFEKYPNLYADLSAGSALRALQRDLALTKSFLTRFADRLLFGRDYHGKDLHQFLQSLDLPEDVRQKIYCDNALRLIPPKDTVRVHK
jgi:hypothetical protein